MAKRALKTTINGKTVYCAVYCKDCMHHEECNAKRKEMGIVTFVEGLVDCAGYEPVSETGKQVKLVCLIADRHDLCKLWRE